MAKTLSLSGIQTGDAIEARHVSQSIKAFTGAEAYDITISGSLTVEGPISNPTNNLNNLSASYALTASHALNGGSGGSGGVGTLQQVMQSGSQTNIAITSSTDISASGNLISNQVLIKGGILDIQNEGSPSSAKFYCEDNNLHYTELKAQSHSLFTGNPTTLLPSYDFDFEKPHFQANITASGAISASGALFGRLSNNSDSTLKVVVIDDASGRLYRTGSYSGGGGGSVVSGSTFPFSGSAVITGSLLITSSNQEQSLQLEGSGSTIFSVEGSRGTLFSVDDDESDGVLFSANNVSGIPVLEVHEDNTVKLGKQNGFGIIISGSNPLPNDLEAKILITGSTHITGSLEVNGDLKSSLIDSSNTNYKTVVVDPTTGKFYRTGSYAGGGGGSAGSGSGFPFSGSAVITGSLEVTGSITGSSGVINQLTASYAITASSIDPVTNFKPIVTHTSNFNSEASYAGHYNIVGGTLTITVTTGSGLTPGVEWDFFQTSSGDSFTFTEGTGVDIVSRNNHKKLAAVGSAATLKYISGQTFHLVGDLTI